MKRRKFVKLGASALLSAPFVISRNLPLFANSSSSHIVSVYDGVATTLNTTPGKKPNGDGVIVDKVLSYSLNRTRISNMIDTAVMKFTGESSVGKAWESLFPTGHPTTKTTIGIKLNMSYGDRVDENNW